MRSGPHVPLSVSDLAVPRIVRPLHAADAGAAHTSAATSASATKADLTRVSPKWVTSGT
jgi:hypothetical protein